MFGGKVLKLGRVGWQQRYPDNWKVQSKAAKELVGGRCSNLNCNRVIDRSNPLQTHHAIALSRGGQNIGMNYMPLCLYCHKQKERRWLLPRPKRIK